jgi:virginiamycin A acetyltransferase
MTRFLKRAVKLTVIGVSFTLMFPLALLAGFGRFRAGFQTFATAVSLIPGLPGDYLRIAYYAMTLSSCSVYSRVSFGSFFAQSSAEIAQGVYIGSYCVLGNCRIGERTQIASMVQILSGARQHGRDEQGRIQGAEKGVFTTISIGADCWIGASAIIMADVGPGTTIGAGSVVTRPVPANVVAVGNPARVIRELAHSG